LSKLGLVSRSEARALIEAGRVRVNGRIVTDSMTAVVPERVRIAIDEGAAAPPPWRLIAVNKPRGVLTTRRDPERRRTIYDVLNDVPGLAALKPVGRLDRASSGLLLLTTDTRLAGACGSEVTRLTRVAFGGLGLDGLAPGKWRDIPPADLPALFPGAPQPRRPSSAS
jgi:16S rRNA U516 pseudouridylate synthase RsuA-like enzyme